MNETNENYLIETLNLILIPCLKLNEKFSERVEMNLEDLESDAVCFLHEEYLNKLNLTEGLRIEILSLREEILSIDTKLWNVNDFIFHPKWNSVREKTLKLIIGWELNLLD